MRNYLIEASYSPASILFILGLRGLSHPETARRGMHLAEFGMLMAIIGTLLHQEIVSYEWIIAGLLLGSALGTDDRSVGADDRNAAADSFSRTLSALLPRRSLAFQSISCMGRLSVNSRWALSVSTCFWVR